MKKLFDLLKLIPIIGCILFSQIGHGQSYFEMLYNGGNDEFMFASGFPDIVCYNGTISGFQFTNDQNCHSSNSCLNVIIDNIPLADYHVMDLGETLNLQVQVNTRDGQYDFNSVTVYHISNIGLPEQTETTLGSMNPLCLAFPPAQCTETLNVSITATKGSLKDAIVIRFGGWGSYILPMVVTGPIVTEVPALGSIITPQVPYLILHDPPGDASFSEFQSNTTICRSTSTTYESSDGGGFTAQVKVGLAGSVGVIIEQDFEFSIGYTQDFSMSHTNMNSNEEETCVETVNTFQTSSLSSSIGDGADVFVGYGETLIWGVYDIVTYDGCNISTMNGLAYYPDPNGYTTFIKTANDINADIALQLAIAENTSNDIEIRTRAYNQIEVWEDVLALNETNVANATELLGNYNFSGASSSSYSEGVNNDTN